MQTEGLAEEVGKMASAVLRKKFDRAFRESVLLDDATDEALVEKGPRVGSGNRGVGAKQADDFAGDEVAARAGGLGDCDDGALGFRGGDVVMPEG